MAKRRDVALLLLGALFFLVAAHGQGAEVVALGVAVTSFAAGALLVVLLTQEDRND